MIATPTRVRLPTAPRIEGQSQQPQIASGAKDSSDKNTEDVPAHEVKKRKVGSPSKEGAKPPAHGLYISGKKPPEFLMYRAVDGDGDCLFTTLAYYLGKTARQLRNIAIAEFRENFEYWEVRWDRCAPTQKETIMETFEEYLKALNKKGAWGSELEIAAIAARTDFCIIIFAADLTPKVWNQDSEKIAMGWFTGCHYDILIGDLPDGFFNSCGVGGTQGMKGGAALVTTWIALTTLTDSNDGYTSEGSNQNGTPDVWSRKFAHSADSWKYVRATPVGGITDSGGGRHYNARQKRRRAHRADRGRMLVHAKGGFFRYNEDGSACNRAKKDAPGAVQCRGCARMCRQAWCPASQQDEGAIGQTAGTWGIRPGSITSGVSGPRRPDPEKLLAPHS